MEDQLHDEIYRIFFGDYRQPSEDATKLTKAQWKEAGDPRLLLDFLRDKISNRQLNLFAVAVQAGAILQEATGFHSYGRNHIAYCTCHLYKHLQNIQAPDSWWAYWGIDNVAVFIV